MYDGVADFSFEITGSELISLLLENHEIKRLRPRINRAQKAKHLPYIVYQYVDEKGIIRLGTAKNTHHIRKKMTVVAEYQQLVYAKGALSHASREFSLCGKFNGAESGEGPCFSHHIGLCAGICVCEEGTEEYNSRVEQAISSLSISFHDNFMLIDKGRTSGENAVVVVENNRLQGYGFVTPEESISDVETMKRNLTRLPDYPESLRIIRMFADERKGLKKIVF